MPWKVGLVRGPQSSTCFVGSQNQECQAHGDIAHKQIWNAEIDMPDMLLSLGYVLQILKLESWNILNMFALRAGVEGHRSNADDG